MTVSGVSESASPRVSRWAAARGDAVRAVVVLALFVFCLVALPVILTGYWMGVLTQTAVYATVALGLNVLVGRVGLMSLGQIAVLGLGSWIAAKLLFATSLPFPVVLLLAGLLTAAIGVVVGLPALRLSGLYLALITLMFAGAVTIVLTSTNFPNFPGHSFLSHTDSPFGNPAVRRPSFAQSDISYWRFTAVVTAVMFLFGLWHVRSKAGRAWAAIRQSEPSALAAGVNITFYKLWAFGFAAFVTGVAGGLLAGDVGKLYSYQFPTQDSIVLFAVVLMGGVYSLWGAIVAGILFKLLNQILQIWNLNPDLLTILFGVGVLWVLLTAPAGIVTQMPRDLANLGRLLARLAGRGRRAGGQPA